MLKKENTITGNKGEWSEIYAFFKLLADGKLAIADADLNAIKDLIYPIMEVLRYENKKEVKYLCSEDKTKIYIKIGNKNGKSTKAISIDRFVKNAKILIKKIKQNKKGTFTIKEVQDFMEEVLCTKIKAPSKDKSDIHIKIHDYKTGSEPLLGFSIKSQLGGNSTLLNPGKTTNFIFEVLGKIDKIKKKKWEEKTGKELVKNIYVNGCSLKLVGLERDDFNMNLRIVDTKMPEILAEMLIYYYKGDAKSVEDLVKLITKSNPLGLEQKYGHCFYEYKIKNLLTDIALGMTPSKTWKGLYDATGGYIVVKEDGDLVCYHFYRRNEFQEYLFRNTYFDTASTSRYGFLNVYNDRGKYFIKLNLQIRFK